MGNKPLVLPTCIDQFIQCKIIIVFTELKYLSGKKKKHLDCMPEVSNVV